MSTTQTGKAIRASHAAPYATAPRMRNSYKVSEELLTSIRIKYRMDRALDVMKIPRQKLPKGTKF
jgi:hypothetical protein